MLFNVPTYMNFTGTATFYYDRDRKEYEGQVTDCMKHGKGVEYARDGKVRYEGDFVWGHREGKGKEFDEDGHVTYEGEWKGSCCHGHGILFDVVFKRDAGFQSVKRYEGEFAKDVFHGKGVQYYSDGQKKYDGEWNDGKPNGKGIEYAKDTRYEGEFRNGAYHGEGVLYSNETGAVLTEGIFFQGKLDERGTLRKRGREAFVRMYEDMCKDNPHFPALPTCPVCFEFMVEGDDVFVYPECGHRVCACANGSLSREWEGKCVVCRREGGKRRKLY